MNEDFYFVIENLVTPTVSACHKFNTKVVMSNNFGILFDINNKPVFHVEKYCHGIVKIVKPYLSGSSKDLSNYVLLKSRPTFDFDNQF